MLLGLGIAGEFGWRVMPLCRREGLAERSLARKVLQKIEREGELCKFGVIAITVAENLSR
jgi:hypothetical protein